jgi:hypothetical protein
MTAGAERNAGEQGGCFPGQVVERRHGTADEQQRARVGEPRRFFESEFMIQSKVLSIPPRRSHYNLSEDSHSPEQSVVWSDQISGSHWQPRRLNGHRNLGPRCAASCPRAAISKFREWRRSCRDAATERPNAHHGSLQQRVEVIQA